MAVIEAQAAMENDKSVAVRKNFKVMALCFSVNHSCSTAPLIFASSVLDTDVAYLGNGVLYTVSVVSTMLLAVMTVDIVGLKGGLILGTLLYSIYVACFTGALFFAEVLTVQYVLFVSGSTCCGLAAGILWTAEGGYMARSATMLSESSPGMTREAATAELAGDFAFNYLLLEVAGKLAWGFLMHAGMSVTQVGLVYVAMSVASMCALFVIDPVESGGAQADARDTVRKSPFSKLFATIRLWKDPRIWLLSPTNITFGFGAAYLNGYFNATYEAPELGTKSLGTLCAVTVGCAAVLSKYVYGPLGTKFGKGVPITIGALSFAGIPILVLSTNCCEGFGWWMLIFYVLQGSGRAVYESTNKAVFSDFFTGEDTEGAFANCAMQMSVASAALFFASGRIDGQMLAASVMVSAVITPLVYFLAATMKAPDQLRALVEPSEVAPIMRDNGKE